MFRRISLRGFCQAKGNKGTFSIPKKSSSLILCRPSSLLIPQYDYEVVLLKRKQTVRSFAKVLAFPGGRVDPPDTEMAKETGCSSISRITILRELFEQTGIFLSQKPILTVEQMNFISQLKLNLTSQVITKGKIDLQKCFCLLYRKFGIDQSPQQIIRLLTVPTLPLRYDTSFYLKMLQPHHYINLNSLLQKDTIQNTELIQLDQDEHEKFLWVSPLQALRLTLKGEIKLAPPQHILLSIMARFEKFKQLKQNVTEISKAMQSSNMSPLSLPQIVNLVQNHDKQTPEYPYAATFIGDKDFSYNYLIKNQKTEELKKEIQLFSERYSNSSFYNRILLKDQKAFFEKDYKVRCDMPHSLLSHMLSSDELRAKI